MKAKLNCANGTHNPSEGNDGIMGLLGDGDYRPPFRAHHRHTNVVVGILADEVCEVLKQVPPGQANITMRTILSDTVAQVAFALDRAKSVADLRHVARKLNDVLLSAYQFAGVQSAAPSKTLLALFRMSKMMANSHNSEG